MPPSLAPTPLWRSTFVPEPPVTLVSSIELSAGDMRPSSHAKHNCFAAIRVHQYQDRIQTPFGWFQLAGLEIDSSSVQLGAKIT